MIPVRSSAEPVHGAVSIARAVRSFLFGFTVTFDGDDARRLPYTEDRWPSDRTAAPRGNRAAVGSVSLVFVIRSDGFHTHKYRCNAQELNC